MKEEDKMEDTEDRKNWKVGPINVAKALSLLVLNHLR